MNINVLKDIVKLVVSIVFCVVLLLYCFIISKSISPRGIFAFLLT